MGVSPTLYTFMPVTGAKAIGVLYRGVEDDTSSDTPSRLLNRSELEQLNVTGAPVFVEHDYRMNAVGVIVDSWIDNKCQVWIATEMYGEERLGEVLATALNKAVHEGVLRDFSIGLDAVRVRGSGRIHQKWMEASLVGEGKYAGTHITVRGSATVPECIDAQSVVTKYLGTRDLKSSFLTVYPETMSAIENTIGSTLVQQQQSVPIPSPPKVDMDMKEFQGNSEREIASRHVVLAKQLKEQQAQFELTNSQNTTEMDQLRAALAEQQTANAAYKAKEEREMVEYRKSQEVQLAEYIEFAKGQGVAEEEIKAIASQLVTAPNAVWKTIVASMEQSKRLAKAQAESEETLKRFQDHLAATQTQQAQQVSVRASKRARVTTTVDDMFSPPHSAVAEDSPKDTVPLPPQAVHYPTSMAMSNRDLWNQVFSASQESRAMGQPVLEKSNLDISSRMEAGKINRENFHA